MARDSSTNSNRRLPQVTAPVTDERWKTNPTSEVTSDRGQNARRARERRHAENSPRISPPPKPDDDSK